MIAALIASYCLGSVALTAFVCARWPDPHCPDPRDAEPLEGPAGATTETTEMRIFKSFP